MADADLDVIIRQLAKQQNKTLAAAAKKRRDRYLGLAAKAKDAGGKQRFKQLAKDALEQGSIAAKRLQISADNAADSYARAMRKAAEDAAAKDVKASAAKTEAKAPPAKNAKASADKTSVKKAKG